tara:strand:- start:290 stop:712 length:423 start_codon:yes stop_codon:yes gene_type:complete
MKTFRTYQLQGAVEETLVIVKIGVAVLMTDVMETVTVSAIGPTEVPIPAEAVADVAVAVEAEVGQTVEAEAAEIVVAETVAAEAVVGQMMVEKVEAVEDLAVEENLVSIEITAHQKALVAAEAVVEITREHLETTTIGTN